METACRPDILFVAAGAYSGIGIISDRPGKWRAGGVGVACRQNSLAEWANHMTHKLLGKRAEVSLTGEAPKVAAAKNKILNWTLLGLSFLSAAMLFALLPLLYFYPPDVV